VVLTEGDNPKKSRDLLVGKGFSAKEAEEFIETIDFPCKRYISFFGEDKIKFIYTGFSSYIKDMEGFNEKERTYK